MGCLRMANDKRLIDVNKEIQKIQSVLAEHPNEQGTTAYYAFSALVECLKNAPTVDAVEVVHGRWILTANEEYSNYRWNVTAECSECHHSKGEIYAGFFTGFPTDLAREVVLDNAEKVKLDNYCPNCGAKMDGGNEDA